MSKKKIVCSNCGEVYSADLDQCPVCGNVEEEVSDGEMETRRNRKDAKQSMPKAAAVTCVVLLSASLVVLTWYILAQWFPSAIPFPAPKEADLSQTEESTEPSDGGQKECWYLNCDVETLLMNHEGATKTLQIDVQPADCTDDLVFNSADDTIAMVNQNGIVAAIAEGQTTITVTCGDLSVNVNVVCDFSAKIELNAADVTLTEDEPTFHLQLSNLGESDVVVWQSSNELVATVDADGIVEAVGDGVCNITAELEGQSYLATVTVDFDAEPTVAGDQTGTINSDGIYFRSGPSTESEAIGFFMEGYEVQILGHEDEWYNVEYNGTVGYVHERYVDLDE